MDRRWQRSPFAATDSCTDPLLGACAAARTVTTYENYQYRCMIKNDQNYRQLWLSCWLLARRRMAAVQEGISEQIESAPQQLVVEQLKRLLAVWRWLHLHFAAQSLAGPCVFGDGDLK